MIVSEKVKQSQIEKENNTNNNQSTKKKRNLSISKLLNATTFVLIYCHIYIGECLIYLHYIYINIFMVFQGCTVNCSY